MPRTQPKAALWAQEADAKSNGEQTEGKKTKEERRRAHELRQAQQDSTLHAYLLCICALNTCLHVQASLAQSLTQCFVSGGRCQEQRGAAGSEEDKGGAQACARAAPG